jgi:hypothetical protein
MSGGAFFETSSRRKPQGRFDAIASKALWFRSAGLINQPTRPGKG